MLKNNKVVTRMDFNPIKFNKYTVLEHSPMPNKLIYNPLYSNVSTGAIVLFSLLLNMISLSNNSCQKGNKRWMDKDNSLFCFFTRQKACQALRVSEPTAKKCFDELIKAGLINEVVQGVMKPNKIYVSEPVLLPEHVAAFNAAWGKVEDFPDEPENEVEQAKDRTKDSLGHSKRFFGTENTVNQGILVSDPKNLSSSNLKSNSTSTKIKDKVQDQKNLSSIRPQSGSGLNSILGSSKSTKPETEPKDKAGRSAYRIRLAKETGDWSKVGPENFTYYFMARHNEQMPEPLVIDPMSGTATNLFRTGFLERFDIPPEDTCRMIDLLIREYKLDPQRQADVKYKDCIGWSAFGQGWLMEDLMNGIEIRTKAEARKADIINNPEDYKIVDETF
jgi:hypothetical protein